MVNVGEYTVRPMDASWEINHIIPFVITEEIESGSFSGITWREIMGKYYGKFKETVIRNIKIKPWTLRILDPQMEGFEPV